jgi:hypothetical protein
MKCPYRKIITHKGENQFRDALDVESFQECYYSECPFYYFNYDEREHECMKAQKEVLIDAK